MPLVAVMVPYARVQLDGFHGELLKRRRYISCNEAEGGDGLVLADENGLVFQRVLGIGLVLQLGVKMLLFFENGQWWKTFIIRGMKTKSLNVCITWVKFPIFFWFCTLRFLLKYGVLVGVWSWAFLVFQWVVGGVHSLKLIKTSLWKLAIPSCKRKFIFLYYPFSAANS